MKAATEKGQNEALQDELVRARRLIKSHQSKLQESEATLVLLQQMKRVSEFEMEKLESGGTVRVIMQKEPSTVDEARTRTACQRLGCCHIELLYDSCGGYEEYQLECRFSVRYLRNVVLEKTSRALSMYSVHLSKCDPCPSPLRSQNTGLQLVSDPAQTMCAM